MFKSNKKKKERSLTDPGCLCNWEDQASPYYTDRHKRWRKHCRTFVDKEILPYIDSWEKKRDVPTSFYKKLYDYGLYAAFYPKEIGGTPFEWEKLPKSKQSGREHDPFMGIILNEELCRSGAAGIIGAGFIHGICVAPVLLFGNEKLQKLMLPCVRAEKFISLAISETQAGSDVRNITTKAVKDPKTGNWIVNGSKYWITGGMKSDYFVTAVRTGGPGIFGISLMLIPRQKGLITTRLPLQGHETSATAYVVFKDCVVPPDYIIGKVNQGFQPIVANFNYERFGIISTALGLARTCVDESILYARSRRTFGKLLIEHQVIRFKLCNMARRTLSVHAFMELCAYRMSKNEYSISDRALVKDLSLLKVEATQCLEYCAREARQIFGGRAYVKGGRAAKVERIYRDVSALAVYGGSEEIMIDLASRQAKL